MMTFVTQAQDAVDRLSVALHYRACGHGVGRKPLDRKTD
jgi:hypothetical protein